MADQSEAAARQFRRLVAEVDCIAVELDAARLLTELGEARAAVAAAARGSASAVAVRVQWPVGLRVGSGPAVTEAFAAVLADVLTGGPARYTGSRTVTRLKAMDLEVAAMGDVRPGLADCADGPEGADPLVNADRADCAEAAE